MAGIKISALPAIVAPALTDVFPVVQSGTTYQESCTQLGTLFGFSSGILAPANGGTGVANPANLTFGGAFTMSGAFTFAGTLTGNTAVTFPISGTLATTTSASGIVNAGLINQLAYYAAAGTAVSGLATANNGTLITSGAGIPSISSTLPSAVQTNITALGTQSQALNMNSHLINNVTDPVSAQDAATKNYVDQTALNGTSVYAASTTTLGTVTQSGAGVGATLTNAGAQATFALDGVNPPVGSNVLIKNTSTGAAAANEGIYTVTSVGSGATNWVLTRATSYDTAVEINNTGLIIVQNGSTLAGTSWYNANTIVTVDTTAFSYNQFAKAKALSVVVQVFAATGTYTPTSGMVNCIVEIVGGGGGSGGSTGAGGQAAASSGGGGSGYCRKNYTATLLGATAAVVIGTGGAAGTSGNNAGGTGVSSTFTPAGAGVVLTAAGGTGGAGMASTATSANGGNGGTGGTGSNGDINIPGGYGTTSLVVSGVGGVLLAGIGGSSFLGNGMNPVNNTGTNGAINYGNGAQGVPNSSGGNVVGSAGAPGICIVTEYILT